MTTLPPSSSQGQTALFINPPAAKKRKLDQISGFNALKNPAIAGPIMERHDLVLDAFQKADKVSSYKEAISAIDWLNKTLEMVPDYLSRFSRKNKNGAIELVRNNQGFPRINGLIAKNHLSKSQYFRAFLRAKGVPLASESEVTNAFATLTGWGVGPSDNWLELGKTALRTPGLSINLFDDFLDMSPLHVLVGGRQNELLKETLKAPGINPNVFQNDETPLHRAAAIGNVEQITTLLTHPETNPNLKTLCLFKSAPLHLAATRNKLAAIKALLKGGARVDEKDGEGDTPLHCAANDDRDLALRALIQAGANVNAKNNEGRTPAHFAAENGETQALRTLVEAGSDLSEKAHYGLTPLHLAAEEGELEAVNLLLTAGASPDQKATGGRTPLMSAIMVQEAQIALAMLQQGANINLRDESGRSALYYASLSGNMTLFNELLDRNAQFNAMDYIYGFTPLHVAIIQRNRPAVARLMVLRGTVNAMDNLKRTALHHAAYEGQSGILEDLLRHTDRISHLNTPDQEGNAPLHLAVLSGDVDTVRLLLAQPGIQLNRKNKWNETPLHLAKYEVKSLIIEHLLSEALGN